MAINKVLVVDDDEDWREILQESFQRDITSDVELAEDYDSAMAKIRQNRYDLIVLDSLEGDCFKICQEMTNIKQGELVIFSADNRVKDRADERGINFYDKCSDGLDKLIERYRDNK
ncbi:MAG: response regulator [Nanoarchaeota archaeon]